jgi:hypothetical protein
MPATQVGRHGRKEVDSPAKPRGVRAPLSCFALQDSFSAVSRLSGPIFMFCAPGLIFGGIEGVGSHFHDLHAQSHFRRYRGVGSHFHDLLARTHFLVLRDRTHLRRFRGRQVLFSCFARPDSISTVLRASNLIFMFCAPGLVFGGTECVGSRFLVLRSRTHFRPYRGCWVPFSCFSLLDSFSAVPRASGPVFMFCTPGLVFGGSEVVGSRFHILRSWTRFRRY